MNIKLYIVHPDMHGSEMPNSFEFSIKGKTITYISYPDYSNPEFPFDGYAEKRLFSYDFDNTYRRTFLKLKLNHCFYIDRMHDDDDSEIADLKGYVHLNWYKRVRLGWYFRKTWIQKSDNLKWLIGLIVSLLSGFFLGRIT